MEKQMAGGAQNAPALYDYRLYDQIWRRVSPELDPYPEVRAALSAQKILQQPPAEPAMPPVPVREEPVEEICGCMCDAARRDLAALERLIEEELAQSQHCLHLARRVRNPSAARFFCRAGLEKGKAAQRLLTVCFLITGQRLAPHITAEPRTWSCLADAIRAFYHQESRGACRYRQGAESTGDVCLRKLLEQMGQQADDRAEAAMELLETILR